MLGTVRRVSTAEAVAQHLIEQIRVGTFGPGDALPSERELQDKLGVGRLSLREGLARLSALGIIQVDHGKGATVQQAVSSSALGQVLLPLFPERDSKVLEDLLRTRSLIDGELACQAALKRTDKDLAALEELLDSPGQAMEDDAALAELDFSFHREIARIGDNAFLSAMVDALAGPIRSFLTCYVKVHGDRESVIERHRPILNAVRDGNADQARQAACAHLQACKSSVDMVVKSLRN